MLNVLSVSLVRSDRAGEMRATRSLERQGFFCTRRIEWEGGSVAAWGFPGQREIEDCILQTPSGTACCVGPLWFRGHFGRHALAAILDEIQANGHLDESDLRGNFALFLTTGEHTWLLNDALGFVRIHASADGGFFSTSWLATCAYLQHVELDVDSALEYVLTGAAHSCHTAARGVDLLPLGHALDLKRRCTWQRFPEGFGARAAEFSSLGEAVETISKHLKTVSLEVASAFLGRVSTALSGGFDSRLIVAGLLAAGAQPRLFVYGDPQSTDVVIARIVADANGLALDAIDKSALNRRLSPPNLASLEQSAWFFDGLPCDGIYDPGADRQTRLQQSADGCIALNGGGGEIFRNFFHLPARAYTARDIVRTFYRGFSRSVFRDPKALTNYETRLGASMRDIMDVSNAENESLTRAQVELLYPLFRCHYWMSVNNSVAMRHGYYATPLVDLELIRMAQRLPLRWKNAGEFQSRLIASIHPGIAEQPSAYGFRFDDGPGWGARLAEWATCARPVWLRPLINATRRRLGNGGVDPGQLQRFRELVPGEWLLDPFLDLAKLPDDGALARALAIEVVWRRII